jgi:hypothetical protein
MQKNNQPTSGSIFTPYIIGAGKLILIFNTTLLILFKKLRFYYIALLSQKILLRFHNVMLRDEIVRLFSGSVRLRCRKIMLRCENVMLRCEKITLRYASVSQKSDAPQRISMPKVLKINN